MDILYYDYYGRPAKITPDEEGYPDVCEIYEPGRDEFVRRNDLLLDVTSSSGSCLIDEAQFTALVEKARTRAIQSGP